MRLRDETSMTLRRREVLTWLFSAMALRCTRADDPEEPVDAGGDLGNATGGATNAGETARCTSDVVAMIPAEGHVLTVPRADVEAPSARSYTTVGGDHGHVVTLSAAQMSDVRAGLTVTVVSSIGGKPGLPYHSHSFTLACG